MHDLHNNCRAVRAVDPSTLTTIAGITGKIIDRQGWGGVEFIFAYGATGASTADIPVVIKEGDVTGTLTSVANADLNGTEVLAGIPDGTARTSGVSKNVVKRIGYKGNKRYVQANIGTVSAAMVTVANRVSVTALLHDPSIAPTTNP
jgi:hypothetical protein